MAMKEYYTLSKFPELEPYHHIQFSVILRASLFLQERVLTPLQVDTGGYSKPH